MSRLVVNHQSPFAITAASAAVATVAQATCGQARSRDGREWMERGYEAASRVLSEVKGEWKSSASKKLNIGSSGQFEYIFVLDPAAPIFPTLLNWCPNS